jgi:ribonuclease BN (tRNA processing enzyme)
MSVIQVIFLGTGDAFSAGGRHQAAYLVKSPGCTLLLDCGATILASLNKQSLSAEPIDAIFLSHIHGDHFAGLPFLFLHYIYVEPRIRPLTIFGPPGVDSSVRRIFEAMYADSAAEPLPFALEFVEVHAGEPICFKSAQVIPFQTLHQERPISLGFEIMVEGQKIVYTGDSGWTEELVEHTQKADLFICECTFFQSRSENHLDYPRIQEILGRFGTKRIVLTHLGQEVLARQKEVDLQLAFDGLIVQL